MTPDVLLVSQPQIDWAKFVPAVTAVTSISPTRQLDNCNIPVGSPPTYLVALSELINPGGNPLQIGNIHNKVLRQLDFSFLVSADRDTLSGIFEQCSDFDILMLPPSRNRENFMLKADLYTWKISVCDFCKPDAPSYLRELFNVIWVNFDKLGFRDLFRGRRKELPDKTFALELPRA